MSSQQPFDKIQSSEPDLEDSSFTSLKKKSKNRNCLLITISLTIVSIFAYTTYPHLPISKTKKIQKNTKKLPKIHFSENSQNPENSLNSKNSKKNFFKENVEIPATEITDPNGNKYKLYRQYKREGVYYTQGFKHIKENIFLESAGLYKKSKLHYIKIKKSPKSQNTKNGKNLLLATVEKEKEFNLEEQFFAEGCDIFLDNNGEKVIYQLTWREKKIFKYNMNLEKIATLDQPNEISEGWGIAVDEKNPKIGYISDGSATIFKVDTSKKNFEILKKIEIKDKNGNLLRNLNELEFVEGYLYANVYLSKRIVKIDLEKGEVVKDYDLSFLVEKARDFSVVENGRRIRYDECLNGIAFDREFKIFYVTGKDWPLIFEVEFL